MYYNRSRSLSKNKDHGHGQGKSLTPEDKKSYLVNWDSPNLILNFVHREQHHPSKMHFQHHEFS